jgi:hypothetical protein
LLRVPVLPRISTGKDANSQEWETPLTIPQKEVFMSLEEYSSFDLYPCPICGQLHDEFEEALICWDDYNDTTTMTIYLWTEFPFKMAEFSMIMAQAREIRGRVTSYTTWGSTNFLIRTSIVVESN